MRLKKIVLFLFAASFMLGSAGYAAAKAVTFSSESGNPGDTVTVSINVDSVHDIAGYNIDFTYDSTVLTATGAAVGSDFGDKYRDPTDTYDYTYSF